MEPLFRTTISGLQTDIRVAQIRNYIFTVRGSALGLLAGILGGCYLLIIRYINRDAKRRGMSPTLWTIVAIIIPNALGIILYFVLRLPLRSACPQCSHAVLSGFSFCPHCSYRLSPSCPQCQRAVGVNDVYCPYCGTSLPNPNRSGL